MFERGIEAEGIPRFMALRALGRSRVRRARPFSETEPRTKEEEGEADMAEV